MKKTLKLMVALFIMAITFVATGVSASAAAPTAPAAPTGVTLYNYQGDTIQITWKEDPSLYGVPYSNIKWYGTCGYGYEVTLMDAKGRVITTKTGNYTVAGLPGMQISSSKVKKAGYKVRVRSYLSYMDETSTRQYLYSAPTTKVFVPRATIKTKKCKNVGNGVAKILWNKVSGAKSYTLYISSNDGKSFKKVTTTSKTSATTKKLKEYKNYYVYVQANGVKVGGKKYNSTKMTKNKKANAFKFYVYTKYTYY